MVTVEQLYKKFGVLADAKDKAGEHEEEFLYIISAVKGGPGEKRLASQFVTRFFKYFPKLAYQAINALFDLCEDDDINIRKQAIKDLPTLCKVNAEHVPKIAEALTQLLQCDDPLELGLIHCALNQLFTINAKSVLNGIFTQIHGDDDRVRDNAIKFLFINLRKLPEDTLNKECQDYITDECKKVLQDVTKEEFIFIMEILKSLSSMNTVMGRQQLLEIVTEQAELDQTFEAADSDVVDRLMSCVKQAAPLFSKNVHSKVFVNYMCNNVLPGLSSMSNPEDRVDNKLDMLKLLAEISDFNGFSQEDVLKPLSHVFTRLIEYMPLPPAEVESDADLDEEPKLQFSYVECLMYTFHQLGRKYPEFLTSEDAAERLKDFRLRLQYFARGVQIYIKQLRQDLQGKTGDALKTEESKLKVCALKVTSNINSLIKDLFHNPPSYKCMVTLSWRPATKTVTSPGGGTTQTAQKRFTPITYEGAANGASNPKKTNREARQLYAPPSGKFSEKAGSYVVGQRGRGGGGRGGGRGRGFRGGRGNRF
ncbi:apoptosis inhibitor 5-like [Ruditapes philippinarum]|uniref:apoptosis inhibitor 5-like n=1 Tax=Ruditapes philippinarum TaxID=129788 RepID=UPI00295A5926|nr:apoptosis inhibitor 5-like [Ruditapes philippinarum]